MKGAMLWAIDANDRAPEQDIDAKLNTLIRRIQQFYADEMERHGFGRKTSLAQSPHTATIAGNMEVMSC